MAEITLQRYLNLCIQKSHQDFARVGTSQRVHLKQRVRFCTQNEYILYIIYIIILMVTNKIREIEFIITKYITKCITNDIN